MYHVTRALACALALVATPLALAADEPAVPADNGVSEESIAAAVARAQELPADEAPDSAEELLGLSPQRGSIELPNGVARLDVPDHFYYLSPADTEKVLVEWGNPPGNETLGMLVPAATGIGAPESWAVVITYDDSGHVADDDAAEIDYAELLADMQAGNAEENEARREAGYGAVELVGWAEDPHYDSAARKLYWAKRLRFEESDGDTLNYSVRVLGREGVLELNAVAAMDQFRDVRDAMPAVIEMASFVDGHRYEDFDESNDRMAAYGLAALVAGGAAAKVGLWAKIVALALAFKKFILFGVVAIGAWVAQRFSGKGKDGTGV